MVNANVSEMVTSGVERGRDEFGGSTQGYAPFLKLDGEYVASHFMIESVNRSTLR